MLMNSSMTIRAAEAESALIDKYHMRPMLIVENVVAACPHDGGDYQNQSGGSRWMSWVISSCYQTSSWTVQTVKRRPVCLSSSILIRDTRRNMFPLMIRRRARSFGVIIIDRCPRGLCLVLLVSRTWRRTWQLVAILLSMMPPKEKGRDLKTRRRVQEL